MYAVVVLASGTLGGGAASTFPEVNMVFDNDRNNCAGDTYWRTERALKLAVGRDLELWHRYNALAGPEGRSEHCEIGKGGVERGRQTRACLFFICRELA